jgi:penicillin-binding protein 1A
MRALRAYWPPPWRHVAIAAVIAVFAGWLLWETCGLAGCPNVEVLTAYQPGNAPLLLDRNGREITRLAPGTRSLVALEDLPDVVPDAFVAVEDRRFRDHGGVDLRRVVGSALVNVRARGVEQGGSTITMQLARNVFPDRLPGRERTMRRKVLEARVAREIEDHFTKDEILELYLNHIYFGGPIWGIDAAARHYFGVPATELDLARAAALAAMPKAPNAYNPRTSPDRARERRDLVLTLMARQGRIDTATADAAQARALRTVRERPVPGREPPPAPYLVRHVRRVLEDQLGDALYTRPLRIHTTIDLDAQAAAEEALTRQLRRIEGGTFGSYRGRARYGAADGVDSTGTRYLQGAAVVMDADSGDVLAMVGGRDFGDSPFDRATQAWRQAGSAFKPFVYAAALAKGYAPSQHLVDEPLEMKLPGGEVWTPRNFGGGYAGEVTLREAAVQSNNVATVRLAMAVGLDEVVREARDAGIGSRLPILPSLALGTAGVTLLEITAAYTPFATLGTAVRPRFVTLVEDTTGREVWSARRESRDVLDPGVAYLVTDLLRDAVDRGTGHGVREAGFSGPAAGKTGTTDEGHDVWFVGYTPEAVAGVWIGFDHPGPIVAQASGGRLAAPVWGRMMRRVRGGGSGDWERPESVVERSVDPASGLVLADGCRPERGGPVNELFLEDALPSEICPEGGDDEPGFFTRIARGVKSFFGSVGSAVAGLFDGDDEEDAEQERYLGKPRLPQASRTPRVAEPDTTTLEPPQQPIGVPLDSLPGWGDVPVRVPDTVQGGTGDTDGG